MKTVYISIGSNIDTRRNIREALHALSKHFGDVALSRVYESEAVGFSGDNFLNLVAEIKTEIPVKEISRLFKKIEDDSGRDRSAAKFSARTLDLDILTWGDEVGVIDGVEVPRQEITENAFVLLPLSEIAPQELHPVLQKSYAELWQEYDQSQQALWPVEL